MPSIIMAAPLLNVEPHTFRSALLHSVVNEAIAFLIQTPVYPLPLTQRFAGFGVYVLYYLGDFEPYDFLAVRNQAECTHPIYVGKAVDRKYTSPFALSPLDPCGQVL